MLIKYATGHIDSRLAGPRSLSPDDLFSKGFVGTPGPNRTLAGDPGVDPSFRKARAIPPENMPIPRNMFEEMPRPLLTLMD
jgi:hypothetical protein